MVAERGGFNERLLIELLRGRVSRRTLLAEGYTDEEITRGKVISSMEATSDAVSIGPEAPCET